MNHKRFWGFLFVLLLPLSFPAHAGNGYLSLQLLPVGEGDGFDVKRDEPLDSWYEYPNDRHSIALGYKWGEVSGIDLAYEVSLCGIACTFESLFHQHEKIFQANGFNLLGYTRSGGWEYGAGLLYYPGPYEKYTRDGKLKDRITFEPAFGAVVKIERQGRVFTFGIRYEDVTFKADDRLDLAGGKTSRYVDSQRVIFSVGLRFD